MLGFGPIGSAPIGGSADALLDDWVERGRRMLEEYVGLPQGILTRIWSADDWTFVLQLHGLLDVAVDHIVVRDVIEPTRSWVLDLDLQSGKGSKVQFGVSHGRLSKQDVALVRNLSKLRAKYAHDIQMTAVSLGEFLEQADNADLLNGLQASIRADEDAGTDRKELRRQLLERPRDVLFVEVAALLGRAFDAKVVERHSLRTESGELLMTEDGRTLIEESAPSTPRLL